MQPMIGKDAVLLLINHRIAALTADMRLGNSNRAIIQAQIACLEGLKYQIDFILPIEVNRSAEIVQLIKA